MSSVPTHGLQIVSTFHASGELRIELVEAPVPAPGTGQVLIRVEAAPINPSDLLTLAPCVDPAEARFSGPADRPVVIAKLAPAEAASRAKRFGQPMTVGLEGAGSVIAAGSDVQHLVGKRVGALSLNSGFFAQFRLLDAADCVVLPDDATAAEGAALFCNPLTALTIAETAKVEGRTAIIQTAAASNLGQMLLKICLAEGIAVVNVVRRPEQAKLLHALGATYVCDSSAPTFHDDLVAAIQATGAMVAFDAIGGGSMAHRLLVAMEGAAVARMPDYSPYGSYEFKQVYTYGHLDQSAMALDHSDYGLLWSVAGWVMPTVLQKVGEARAAELRARVVAEFRGIFASEFSREISLADVLRQDVMAGYFRQSTGGKVLINPFL